MSPKSPQTVHCWETKRNAVWEAYEELHGVNSFIGSPAWLATFAHGWVEGHCCLGAGHVGDHVFTDCYSEEEARKAS